MVELRVKPVGVKVVSTEPGRLAETVAKLYGEGCYYVTMAAVDERELGGGFTLYHVLDCGGSGLVVVHTELDPGEPVAESITDTVPVAEWYEAEAYELMGIRFEGRSYTRGLFLPEWWPENHYPLRRDVKLDSRPPLEKALEHEPPARGLPVGPYHPALHEPELFELVVEGETIVDVRYRGFHVHRGIEKLAETKLSYDQIPFLAERICGICGYVHSTCYVQAVEKASGVEVPDRARYLRTLLLEVERIHSHMLWFAIACHLLGYDTGFMQAMRAREPVMIVAEKLTGSRKMYSVNRIGGLRWDIPDEKAKSVLRELREAVKEFMRVVDAALSVPELVKRLEGTGVLEEGKARRFSVVGPTARGSGLPRDVRRDHPYAAYGEVEFKVVTERGCDNLARLMVRVREVEESLWIIEQVVDKLPATPVTSKVQVPEKMLTVSLVEAPRGEDAHLLITGKGRPYRWRVRAPTYQNLQVLPHMLRGAPLAEAPATIATIDPCFSCTDRVVVVDSRSGSWRITSLRRLAAGWKP